MFVFCMNLVLCVSSAWMLRRLTSDGSSYGHEGPESASPLNHHFANILDKFPAPQSHPERTETSEYGS